jgi:NAD(P)-dependent dehydrogenase (short-subunit alcohol dehydrogenase family)
MLLLPELEKRAPARIVNVASNAHSTAPLNFDDLMAERRYSSFIQYGRSKLCNILFTRELARRLDPKRVTVNALHPGFVASEFLTKGGIWSVIKPIANVFAIDEVAGARTSVYLASSPEVEGVTGKYFYKCREKTPHRRARDDEAARRLWEVSERLTGLRSEPRAA